MKVGVYVFATDLDLDPGPLALEIEQRGFDSMFFPEHSHIPVSRETDYPDSYGGGVLPDFYKRTYDPFISCSFAAAATSTLEVGTGIALLALRDAVHTAKLVASVDRLSGGRFTFGVGFGWNKDEYLTHGVDWSTRHRKVREQVALMREMWTQDIASYDGELVSLPPSWCWPKPVQEGGPKVYLGGSGPVTMRHAAEWADVWYPTPPMADPLLEESIPRFRELLADAGRDPDSVPVGVAPGSCDEAELEAYLRNGVSHINFFLGGENPAQMLENLDALAKLRTSVLGR
ncbi:MAG TPA: LLM class F420-dependent oxidoreductase [Nocardioides sp.]|uniref:LLM class F420-dependent oxidoreductase n=1 Tax=uncultured Nocardioides sp. TaxID=198441 RepID=UPI000EE1681B|nr:LLM class F420-dependent oxidoreductase [uncultured Nocardioides sp.]HCB05398.1 LLM class F420-dependent oxidoreductase [Nocardioides sp.]HRD59769.1 LLM class F420-dependent oxidoreductase [Nocardioides sp.]HRI96151.1 LLM class F420-dependent oxidoreductase [Nocardioides sp.]HRK47270.1 LLM class F420-dependent oxidoreductase [Nocardioides sp.]